jgi:hypothetical protein
VRGEVVSITLLGLDGIVGIGGIALGLALPESALLGVVLGVVVGLGLLAAAVPDESQLSKDGEEEEDAMIAVSAVLSAQGYVLTVQRWQRQSKPC